MQLIKVLKKVANAGSSVLFTIHQPSSDVFNSFDQIILMNSGQVMASGTVDDMHPLFSDNGHTIPDHYNPADWMMVRWFCCSASVGIVISDYSLQLFPL